MSFIADKQTIDDLNIFGRHGRNCVYALFNRTMTRGVSLLLEYMFRSPLSDSDEINARSGMIRYFQEQKIEFPFRNEIFDIIDNYLSNVDTRTQLAAENNTLKRKVNNMLGADTEYEQLHKGVLATIEFLCTLQDVVKEIKPDSPYRPTADKMAEILEDARIANVYGERGRKKLAYEKTADYDRVLRYQFRDELKKLLSHIFLMDVYITIAKVATERDFCFAKAIESDRKTIKMEGVYHPLLKKAISNDIDINPENNVIFLTGANMAGKSTFMKTFSIAVFLAHMGFPVPAKSMTFTASRGMFTTINLSDNINMGYSHFYAEVMRVKKVAQEVGHARDLIVVFDELFRGTNVKDAYDATVAVTEAFAANKNCVFIISTHILEAAEELKHRCDNMNYIYLPTVMKDGVPTYTYKIAKGITEDRHGMIIIRNEHILDILAEGKIG
jgi:DNA mismatch repair ATPase MutS